MPRGGGTRDLAAYTPSALSGKYQFGLISDAGKDIIGFNWINHLYLQVYDSEQTTRESCCPSAMVDTQGDLYTATFEAFPITTAVTLIPRNGPEFSVRRYVCGTNNAINLSKETKLRYDLFPVTCDNSSIYYCPYYPSEFQTRVSVGFFSAEMRKYNIYFYAGIWPLVRGEQILTYLSQCIHFAFSPTIAQETGTSNDIYVVINRTPHALAYTMNGYFAGEEGFEHLGGWIPKIWIYKINKNNFGSTRAYICRTVKMAGTSSLSFFLTQWPTVFHVSELPFRASSWSYKLQPEWGNIKAVFDNDALHIFQLKYKQFTENKALCAEPIYLHKFPPLSSDTIERSNGDEVSSDMNPGVLGFSSPIDGCIFLPRFQKINNTVYWGAVSNGYQHNLGTFSGVTPALKNTSSFCTKIESSSTTTNDARYPTDFCIIPNGSNPIVCWLGFKYSQGWNSGSRVNWADNKLACVLYSAPMSNFSWQTYPQNTLYVTDIVGGTCDAVNSSYSSNTSASDLNRLYLNTQNIVPCTINDKNYIIYAYCYPGKSKQLYLGFAQYFIDKTSHVKLMTLYEFRDASGNSFGNFTDCSRIISMDLQNDHLWITFMNTDSTAYYYFHIRASDLIGEATKMN